MSGFQITKFQMMKQKPSNKFLIAILGLTILAIYAFHFYGYGIIKIIRYILLMYFLIIIAQIDAKSKRIPNQIIISMLWMRLIILIIEIILNIRLGYTLQLILAPIMGLLFGGGIFLISYIISRKGIGMGDVKLFAVIGAYTGPGVLMPCIIISLFLSALYSIIMLVRKKLTLKDSFAFGPFAAVGTIITLLVGF